MPSAIALVPTASVSKYLQQLCKHWSHNLEVEFSAGRGTINFPRDARGANWPGEGHIIMIAHPDSLEYRIDASAPGQLEALKGALARHLDRFAFRKASLRFEWRTSCGGNGAMSRSRPDRRHGFRPHPSEARDPGPIETSFLDDDEREDRPHHISSDCQSPGSRDHVAATDRGHFLSNLLNRSPSTDHATRSESSVKAVQSRRSRDATRCIG